MKKDDMFQLASFGVRTKLAMMERELRALHRHFPEAFASETPPVLLRPEKKTNGNDWPVLGPALDETVALSPERSSGWTPARRAKQARFMKTPAGRARVAKMIAARHRKKKTHGKKTTHGTTNGAAPATWGTKGWQRAHDFLLTQPNRTARVEEIVAGAKITSAAAFITGSYDYHPDLFARVGKGAYKLKKVMEH